MAEFVAAFQKAFTLPLKNSRVSIVAKARAQGPLKNGRFCSPSTARSLLVLVDSKQKHDLVNYIQQISLKKNAQGVRSFQGLLQVRTVN